MVERTLEPDYVRFRPWPDLWVCGRAALGKSGGEQFIDLRPVHGCGVGTVVHEIGHAVGLRHEHQRQDRDRFVSVSDSSRYGELGNQYISDAPVGGPYDYASSMHYCCMRTIPPGNAGGIGTVVGGGHRRGSQAVRKAPDSDRDLDTSSGPGDRCRRRAHRDSRAVRQESRQPACPASAVAAGHGCGAVRVRALERRRRQPAQRDGRPGIHVVRGALHRPAQDAGMRRPARGRGAPGCGQFPRFPALGACPRSAIPRGQARRTVIPGTSSNPASGCACTWSRWSSDGSRLGDSAAIYSAQPRLRADSNVDGIVILADGASKRLPRAFPTGACPRGVTLEAPATVPDEANQDDDLRNHDMRYRFHSWSDGESRSHEVAVPATDGRVRLKLTHEYRLRTSARNQTDKNHVAIDISPPFEDGFYADS